MANERTFPCLPCRNIDESIAFYESMGFSRTYRQIRPNSYAVVSLEDVQIHLFGMEGFDPAESYGIAIVEVPNPDDLYHAFADGLRRAFGRLPVAGIPRILRPRKRYGTVRGFTVVDPGGNWLRISRLGDAEDGVSARTPKSLSRFVEVAARLADSHGDEALALRTLQNGLARHPDAPPFELAKAYLYRAELEARTERRELAVISLAAAQALGLDATERAELADDFAYAIELVS